MYCKNCGKQIDNDSNFCSFCGTKQTFITQQIDNRNIDSKPDAKTVSENLSFGSHLNPKQNSESIKIEKYDTSYQKEAAATVFGVILIVINIGLLQFGGITELALYPVILIISFFLRINITIWCSNIAKRQNRDSIGWGFFAFLLPALTLIIIGLQRKLKKNNLTTQNNTVVDTKIQKPKTNRIVLRETADGKTLKIHSSLSVGYTIGDVVTINDIPAPDGKYKVGFMDSLLIENGKLKSL